MRAAAIEFQLKQVWKAKHSAAKQLDDMALEKRELAAENERLRRRLAQEEGGRGGGGRGVE